MLTTVRSARITSWSLASIAKLTLLVMPKKNAPLLGESATMRSTSTASQDGSSQELRALSVTRNGNSTDMENEQIMCAITCLRLEFLGRKEAKLDDN